MVHCTIFTCIIYVPASCSCKEFNYWRQKSSGYTVKPEGNWTWLILRLLNNATLTADVIQHCTRWQHDYMQQIYMTGEAVIIFSMSTADVPITVSTRYIRNTVRNKVKITRWLEIQYIDLNSLDRWYKWIRITQSDDKIKSKGKTCRKANNTLNGPRDDT